MEGTTRRLPSPTPRSDTDTAAATAASAPSWSRQGAPSAYGESSVSSCASTTHGPRADPAHQRHRRETRRVPRRTRQTGLPGRRERPALRQRHGRHVQRPTQRCLLRPPSASPAREMRPHRTAPGQQAARGGAGCPGRDAGNSPGSAAGRQRLAERSRRGAGQRRGPQPLGQRGRSGLTVFRRAAASANSGRRSGPAPP